MNKEFAKELAIRRRISNVYNKRPEHFSSLREYNDYLEEVEDLTANLIDGVDVQATEAKVKAYQEENYEQIIATRAQKAVDLAAVLQQERGGGAAAAGGGGGGVGGGGGEENALGQSGYYAPAVAAGGGGMQQRQPEPVNGGGGGGGGGDDGDDDPERVRMRSEKAAIAGGWSNEFVHRRSLQEAFSSIWVN